jgi:rare lipoprotein A (peptidoglycan hydrolase)
MILRSRAFPLVLSLSAALGSASCHRQDARRGEEKNSSSQFVFATWYKVPANSLARRRASLHELTAASDQLKLGALVKVTRVSNGKSVVVRITDRGLHSKKSRLDLCEEAAEQLDMIRDGIGKVSIEILE